MFDSIINFFNALWEKFITFIKDILDWILELILSLISLILIVVKYMFWQALDYAIGIFSPWIISLIDTLPDLNPWTNNIIGYISTLNQIFPVTELFVCITFIFSFWLITWCVKSIKAFIPTE